MFYSFSSSLAVFFLHEFISTKSDRQPWRAGAIAPYHFRKESSLFMPSKQTQSTVPDDSAIVPQDPIKVSISPSEQSEVIPMIQSVQSQAAQILQQTKPSTFFVFGGSVTFAMFLTLQFLVPLIETLITAGGLLAAIGAVSLGAVKLKAGSVDRTD